MKKRILRIILGAAVIYAGWLLFESVRFRTYRNAFPAADDGREIQGVYHIHSALSDGKGSPAEIARLAKLENLDFIILTDHGNPNTESLRSRGYKDGVLVLAGSELSTNRGHLVALGFREPETPFSQKAEEAVPKIQALGGFAVIAHPYSKVKWSWGDSSFYLGLEIINADTMFQRNIGRIWPYLPLLLIRPRLPLIKMLEHPDSNLKKWDQRNSRAPMFGYFSADAHLFYRAIFSLLHLHVLLDKPLSRDFDEASGQVYDALRKGRFYNAVDAAAEAGGFRFTASGGRRTWRMGDTIPGTAPARFVVRAPFSFSREIRLLHDGKIIASSEGDRLEASAEGPGTYRVEVFLRERTPLDGRIPWIISNPITIGKD